eukprot:2498234-Rhodomonas_salina.2
METATEVSLPLPMVLCLCYAMSGTVTGHVPIVLCNVRYAMSGTEKGYGGTRRRVQTVLRSGEIELRCATPLPVPYAMSGTKVPSDTIPMRCPVPTYHMLLSPTPCPVPTCRLLIWPCAHATHFPVPTYCVVLSPYARAMRCPVLVLTWRMLLPGWSGGGTPVLTWVYGAPTQYPVLPWHMVLRACYAMSGTDTAHGATLVCDTTPSTGMAYDATRVLCDVRYWYTI